MLKKPASAKTVSREASLVKCISQDMKFSACERRDTRDERRTKRTAFLSILRKQPASARRLLFGLFSLFGLSCLFLVEPD